MKCPKCGKEFIEWKHDWYEDQPVDTYTIYNGEYGCDTGCEYVRLESLCSCGFEDERGEFGYYEDDNKDWYLESLISKYNRSYKMS